MTTSAPLRLLPDPGSADPTRIDALRAALREDFLDAAGWDPVAEVFAPRRDHPLLGLRKCVVVDCTAGVRTPGVDLCSVCIERFKQSAVSLEEFAQIPCNKKVFGQHLCRVADCGRMSAFTCGLCATHRSQWQKTDLTVDAFVTTAKPLPAHGRCTVAACSREAESRAGDLCQNHRIRWAAYRKRHANPDFDYWRRIADPINADHYVIFKGLAKVTQLELLVALQTRTDAGTRTLVTGLRAIVGALRHTESTSIYDLSDMEVSSLRSDAAVLIRSLRTLLDRTLSTPETERTKDVWDLGVFGFAHWNLSFADISQPWLKETAKQWAEDNLPQHRGRQGGGTAKTVVAAVTMLSECLRETRSDNGITPAELGRRDIVALINRMAHKERTGEMTAYTRLSRSRYLKRFLHDIRVLGLTRIDGPAAGLPDDFHLGRNDIPSHPIEEEAGRGLPAWVLRIINDNLDVVAHRSGTDARRMIELLIDTGRRPDEICKLRIDCLVRDDADKAVLIYTDSKNNRPNRRLPIAEATARIILDQQAEVRERFPDSDDYRLMLFPKDRQNCNGFKPASEPAFGKLHRDFIDSIADKLVTTVRGPDGVERQEKFDRRSIVPYSYRHSYAQRHADEGVPPDVLRDLMGHDSMQTTMGYYQVTEKRVRVAIDRVSAHQFDGQGRRVFHGIQGLLTEAHARMRVGQVAVPFGICTEPANVKAGGQSCPYKFTCLGCGHFRSDPSYLPELKSYLQQLLADRARLEAATDLQDWAKEQLTPRDQEISQLRGLIRRIEADLSELSAEDQQLINDAVAVVRTTRQTVHLGFPPIQPPTHDESATDADR
ncbi:MAG: site-specific integrase [Mycobacterium sp.]|nr:site-specific integrase [Mycobacterium sp.]